jgi:hypothetical protein
MPLSQRAQYSDRKGMGSVKLGGVICLAAVVFGSICMTIVATVGDGEDPPKIFEQMVLVACALFVVGLVVSLAGVVIYLNQPEPPKPTAAASASLQELDDDDEQEIAADPEATTQSPQNEASKPDPYASHHRRREF